MTTDTTDAEAIARIIDPDVFCFHKSMIEAGLKDGLSADEARATADRCTAHSIPPAVVKAERILSYLALRREAQEPVAWLRDVDGTGSLHPASKGDPGAFPVYTAPPAPAGEVERLRAVLKDAQAAIEQAIDCIRGESPEDMDHANAERDTLTKLRDADHAIATALNGGREDD